MTNKTKPSKELQGRYGSYKSKDSLNKNFCKKLECHLKKFPKDICAADALSKGKTTPRKAPVKKLGWFSSTAGTVVRKESARIEDQISKLCKIASNSNINLKLNIKLNPFHVLESIKSSLPVHKDSPAAKNHTYGRMKTRSK
jgi:hypothetical protein